MQIPVEICWKSEEQNTKEAQKPNDQPVRAGFFGIRDSDLKRRTEGASNCALKFRKQRASDREQLQLLLSGIHWHSIRMGSTNHRRRMRLIRLPFTGGQRVNVNLRLLGFSYFKLQKLRGAINGDGSAVDFRNTIAGNNHVGDIVR
jgi:hypothetical protein